MTEKELMIVLQSLGQNPTPETVKEMIGDIDKDGNGQLEVSTGSRSQPVAPRHF